ncbi:MAG: recombination protein RecA, partial [Hyphomicrobiaceae bacterium]
CSQAACSQAAGSQATWSLASLAGRLCELSCCGQSAVLTLATSLLRQAQHAGEPSAWVNGHQHTFFPPDLADGGIDLAALPVIHTHDSAAAARACDRLIRCGAFSLVIVDTGAHARIPPPLLTRLLGLAQKHGCALVFLTEKPDEEPSLSPLISLRLTTRRHRTSPDRFLCSLEALKDKRHGPGWTHNETFRGPAGLR